MTKDIEDAIEDVEDEAQGDLFFWLGRDGELVEQETMEDFYDRIFGEQEDKRRWREVDLEGLGGDFEGSWGEAGLRDDPDGGAYFYWSAEDNEPS